MSKTIDYTNLNEKSGIYMLINSENNKRYVGSSKNLYDRLHQHFHNLKYNKHHSLHLQASYNKYGESNFEYEILEFCDLENLYEREQYYLDTLRPEFNILTIAGSNLGFKHSNEVKRKISSKLTGISKTEEHKRHIQDSQKGRVFTEEHKKKLSEAAKHRKKASRIVKIMIDNVIYNSIKEASELLNIKYNTIQVRLKNDKFNNYSYIK